MSARWAAGEPVRPGAGQARSTVLAGTARGCGTGWPAATVTVWFHTARPPAAARARTTPARGSIRLALMPVTSPARPSRRGARDPAPHRSPGPAPRGAPGPTLHAAAPGSAPGVRRLGVGHPPPTGSAGDPGAAAGAAATAPRRRLAAGGAAPT